MCLPVCDSVLAWQRTERDPKLLPPTNTFYQYISVRPVQSGQGNTQQSPLFNLVREPSCPTPGWKQTKAWHGSFQLEENRKSVFFIAVIFDSTRLNQEQDKNLLQRLIWALFLEFIQSLNTKSGTNLTLISLAPARTRKPRLRISSTHSEQRNLLSIWFDAFIHNSKSIFNFSPLSWSSKGGC